MSSGALNRANLPSSARHFQFDLHETGERPDPRTHAWREDLADVALAGVVISPHYAAPVSRELSKATPLYTDPDTGSEIICELGGHNPFLLLDCRGDWAWGYGGEDRLVGYIPVDALA